MCTLLGISSQLQSQMYDFASVESEISVLKAVSSASMQLSPTYLRLRHRSPGHLITLHQIVCDCDMSLVSLCASLT